MSEHTMNSTAITTDEKYVYPDGLDLHPNSELHAKILGRIMDDARASHIALSKRHEIWRRLDKMLTGDTVLTADEAKREEESGKSENKIVVPVVYTTLETLLTFWSSIFLGERKIFSYSGAGIEDIESTKKLEAVIAKQCIDMKVALSLLTMWRDGLVYGIAPTYVDWHVKSRFRRRRTKTDPNSELGLAEAEGIGEEVEESEVTRETLSEGSRLTNISPYHYLPDPNVPIDQVQEGEFAGWSSTTNRFTALSAELTDPEGLFNAKYLKFTQYEQGELQSEGDDNTRFAIPTDTSTTTNKVHEITMFRTLIPSEWGLGDSEFPEKWVFKIGNGSIILQASPIDYDHDMYPIVVNAPDTDGHSITPVSRLEMLLGMQDAVNFLWHSHMENTKKVVNDTLIVDPSIINMNDLLNPQSGNIIRTRRSNWGKNNLDGAVKQLNVTDVTANNITSMSQMQAMIQQVSGATDSVSGVQQRSGSRVSASEAQGTRSSATARLEKATKVTSLQAHSDIAYMFAMNTLQFMEKDVYVRILGSESGDIGQTGEKQVTYEDLDGSFDVLVHDGQYQAIDDTQSWVQLLQLAISDQEIRSEHNINEMFRYVARGMGARNVDQFKVGKPQAPEQPVAPQGGQPTQPATPQPQAGVAQTGAL